MVNNEGSSADMLLHLDFCVNKSSFCQYYEQDETVVVTKEKYSQYFASECLHYGVFFRVEDAYDAISKSLDRLGVDRDDQTECIDTVIRQAQKLCVKNMIKGDHRENRILCSVDVRYEQPVEDRQESMEDQDQGMVPVDERQDDQDDGMVPAALPAIRSLGATKIQVGDGESVQQCVICQEEYCNGEKVTCMPCLHMFHRDCITKWLLRSHLCPICKFQMPKYT